MLRGGLKRTLRKPVKMGLFVLLIIVTVTFLTVGIYLFSSTAESLAKIESIYTTVGTVEQINRESKTAKEYDRVLEKYVVMLSNVYEKPISIDLLNFEGADYIHPPENRPFYSVTTEDMPLQSGIMQFTQPPVVEYKIIEEYDWTMVKKAEVVRSVNGIVFYPESQFYIFQHYGEEEFVWDKSKTYISVLVADTTPMIGTSKYWDSKVFGGRWPEVVSYAPALYLTSLQLDKQGNRIDENPYADINNLGIIEVTDDLYDTELGQRLNSMNAGGLAKETQLRVIPTNSLNLLMDFYNDEAYFTDGRAITSEEFAEGKPVCIIQEDMANGNGLAVGDKIDLSYVSSFYGGTLGSDSYIIGYGESYQSSFDKDGKSYEPFYEDEYEIVGIYRRLTSNFWFYGDSLNYYALGYGTIIVPSNSIKVSDENNMNGDLILKPYNVSFQIPNGTVDAYMEKVRELGLDKDLSFTFYDGGYSNIKSGLDDMRKMAVILLLSGAITSLAALFFFTFIFVGKEKKSVAVERSLGVTKRKSAVSMLLGVLLVVVIGAGVGTAVGTVASEKVYGAVQAMSNDQRIDTAFSNWANIFEEGDEGVVGELTGEEAVESKESSLALSLVIFLVVVFVEILIASFFIVSNLKQEPMKLLSSQ